MSLYEDLEVETVPISEISIGKGIESSSTKTSNDGAENTRNLSKCRVL